MQTRATYRWFGIARIIVGIATSTLCPTSIQFSNRSLIGLVKKGNVPGNPGVRFRFELQTLIHSTNEPPTIQLSCHAAKWRPWRAPPRAMRRLRRRWIGRPQLGMVSKAQQSNHQNADDLGMLYEIGWIPAHMCYMSVYMCHNFMYSNTLYNLNWSNM
jgi:hypothetical protein